MRSFLLVRAPAAVAVALLALTACSNSKSSAPVAASTHSTTHRAVSASSPVARSSSSSPRPSSTQTTAGCHPKTNNGGCYEPGELCRQSDHGKTGKAGDGRNIVCRNQNGGWHWKAA